ncbi:replication-relaxation family protein [Pilimelia terevasa]|nr:replication-relaxation family protein [Pilimelia terevasa]
MSASDPYARLHLTPRDFTLLGWLAEHYVLSTDQIAQALFPSVRKAQTRLRALTLAGAVSRFVFTRHASESRSHRYTLGPLGAALHPNDWHDPANPDARPPRTSLERRTRIAAYPALGHLLGVNGFFAALHAVARVDPAAAVLTWWSEQHAASVFTPDSPRLRPDAYGCWAYGADEVEFFLEHDTGTEDLGRVLRKLPAYQALTLATGDARPLLFRLPDSRRQQRLLRHLDTIDLSMTVATSTHDQPPHQAVWTIPGHRERLPLHLIPARIAAR